jgi:hypothetical protein
MRVVLLLEECVNMDMADTPRRRLSRLLAQSKFLTYAELETKLRQLTIEMADSEDLLQRLNVMFAVDRKQPFAFVTDLWNRLMANPTASPRSKFGATMDYAFYCRETGRTQLAVDVLLDLKQSFTENDYNELGGRPEEIDRLLELVKKPTED